MFDKTLRLESNLQEDKSSIGSIWAQKLYHQENKNKNSTKNKIKNK